MLQPPSLLWTLLTFCGECAPRTIRIGYTCRNPARPRRLAFPEEVRAGPRGARIPGCSPWTVILWPVVR